MTENDCPKAWTNRILVLNVVHGLPGDDFFLSRPKMTCFSPLMRGNRGKKLEKLKMAVSRKILGSGWGNTHPCSIPVSKINIRWNKNIVYCTCILYSYIELRTYEFVYTIVDFGRWRHNYLSRCKSACGQTPRPTDRAVSCTYVNIGPVPLYIPGEPVPV